MSVLTTRQRKRLVPSTFGLTAERAYPMPDRAHAANAKARAAQSTTLSAAQRKRIVSKANTILGQK